jgi:hypothetical protein
MTRWNRTAYWLARFFFQQSGEVGVDPYFKLEAEKESQARYFQQYIKKLELELAPLREIADSNNKLVLDLALVDGLLSQGQVDEAQKFLRVAFIKLRRKGATRNDVINHMANAYSQQQNAPGLAGLGGLGGMNQQLDRFDRFFNMGLKDWP